MSLFHRSGLFLLIAIALSPVGSFHYTGWFDHKHAQDILGSSLVLYPPGDYSGTIVCQRYVSALGLIDSLQSRGEDSQP